MTVGAGQLGDHGAIAFALAQPADFDDLVALRIEAMRDSLQRIGRFDPERARARLEAGFSPEHTWHVLRAGERVGFFVLRSVGDDCLQLEHLYIRPSAQGRGMGAAVLARVFGAADARMLPVRVGALRGSDSNRFYARHGFRLVAEGEFDNDYVRAPLMSIVRGRFPSP